MRRHVAVPGDKFSLCRRYDSRSEVHRPDRTSDITSPTTEHWPRHVELVVDLFCCYSALLLLGVAVTRRIVWRRIRHRSVFWRRLGEYTLARAAEDEEAEMAKEGEALLLDTG